MPIPPANDQILNSATITKFDDPAFNDLLTAENYSSILPITDSDEPTRFRSDSDRIGQPVPELTTAEQLVVDLPKSELLGGKPRTGATDEKKKQLLLVVSIAVTTSLLAILGFWIFVQFVGTNKRVAKNDQNTSKETASDKTSSDKSNTDPKVPPNETLEKTPDKPQTNDAVNEPQTDVVNSNPNGNDNPTTPATDANSENSITTTPTAEPSNDQSSNTNVPSTPETAIPTVTPDMPGKTPLTIKDAVPDTSATEDLPDIFKTFRNQFDSNNLLPDGGFGKRQSSSETPQEDPEVYTREFYHPDPKPIPDWDERSTLAFPTLRINNVSLVRCIDMLSRITGTAINIDWPSCMVAGIDLQKQTTVDGKNKTLGEILKSIAIDNDLEVFVDSNGFPTLRAKNETLEKLLPSDWSVNGLFEEASAQRSVEQIIKLWNAETLCEYDGGKISWNDSATPIDKAIMASFLGRLATIKGVSEENPWRQRTDHANFCNADSWQKLLEPLNNRVGLKQLVTEARPITDLLLTAADDTKIKFLIDWPNCWSHGFHPNDSSLTVLRGRTFREISNKFLDDYTLEWIAISDDTLLLTTGAVRRRFIRIVPFKLPRGTSLDDVKQSLKILAPIGPDGRSRFRAELLQDTEDVVLVRVCLPELSMISLPDLERGFGWPERP